MGNVRNPVGPLPSSIYWRRRAVVLCLFAIAVAMIVWAVLPHGGGVLRAGDTGSSGSPGNGSHGRKPLPSITPGPTGSGTGISSEPGGRGSDGTGPAGSSPSGAAGSGPAGSGGSGAKQLPSGSSLPDCRGAGTDISLRGVKSTYAVGQQPQFTVTVVNNGSAACKADFSGVSAVLTVDDGQGGHVWSSADCPASRTPLLFEVPAGSVTPHEISWDLAVTAPHCATPSGGRHATPGSYVARISLSGVGGDQTPFTIGGS